MASSAPNGAPPVVLTNTSSATPSPSVSTGTTTSSSSNKFLAPMTWEQVAQHSTIDDAWVVVNNVVYDITSCMKSHRGGRVVPLKFLGKDATQAITSIHSRITVGKMQQSLAIGVISHSTSLRT
ncbi:hypothetical protein Pelo_9645 [Pelomyxa schiedti]|nr:hypothetical protein Pelo_9645 [Pelomyxa schiedti]